MIVAWLVEYANCYHQEKTNADMLDYFFEMFDLKVKQALNILLEGCVKRKLDVNIDRSYTIHELYDLIYKADREIEIWDWYYKKTGEAFSEIDVSPLLYDPTPQHILLYSLIHIATENYAVYKDLTKKLDKESIYSFALFFLCNDLYFIEQIYSLRNKEIVVSVSKESKEYIQSYRKSVSLYKSGSVGGEEKKEVSGI